MPEIHNKETLKANRKGLSNNSIRSESMNGWIAGLVFFMALAIFLCYLDQPSATEYAEYERKLIKEEFKGVVTQKIHLRGDRFCIRLENGNEFAISPATDSLNTYSLIGDTITKLPNSNICLIKGVGEKFQCGCYSFYSDDN